MARAGQPARARAASRPVWTVVVGALLLGVGGTASWAQALGPHVLSALPALALALLLLSGRLPGLRRAPFLLLTVWIVVALFAASIPASDFRPKAWSETFSLIGGAMQDLLTPGGAQGLDHGWPLALVLIAFGVLWLLGAGLARSSGGRPRMLAFLAFAMPVVAANLIYRDVLWQGAVLVAAAILWASPRRTAFASGGAVAVALIAVGITIGVRPDGPWQLPGVPGINASFTKLNTEQTYGPLGKRSGRTMFEITTSKPGLWRAQILDRFNGSGWESGGGSPDLPQPAAQQVTSTVRIRALRDELVVAPGAITAVKAKGRRARHSIGESWTLLPTPRSGDTYSVTSDVVTATREQLAAVQFDENSAASAYTSDRYPIPLRRFGERWRRTFQLARSLTANASTPLEAVESVQHYLRDSGTFTYATDVKVTDNPITDFLLETHRGYCQHFAGAAATLLRLSGVPARVVVGFATGRSSGTDRYTVRDDDAHAWIEVYFDGIGWVPFNPTPSAADAQVSPDATALPPPAGSGSGSSTAVTWAGAGVGLSLVAVFGSAVRRRRVRWATGSRPDPLVAELERLAGPLPAAHTLGELRSELDARIGPRTAALAARAERSLYARDAPPPVPAPRRAVWRAVRADVGTRRTIRLLLGSLRSAARAEWAEAPPDGGPDQPAAGERRG